MVHGVGLVSPTRQHADGGCDLAGHAHLRNDEFAGWYMNASRRALRATLWTGGILATAGIALWYVGPQLAEGWVKAKIEAEIAERGLPMTVGALELTATQATLGEVCLRFAVDVAEPFACLQQVTVSFSRPSLFSAAITVSDVDVQGGWIDVSSAQGTPTEIRTRLEALRDAVTRRPERTAEQANTPDQARASDSRTLPAVHMADIEVRLAGQGVPLATATLVNADLTSTPESGSNVDVALALGGIALPPFITFATHWTVTAFIPDAAPWSVSLRPEVPLRVQGFGAVAELSASMSALSFTWPYTFAAENLQLVWSEQEEPVVSIPSATLGLRELTTDLDELYFSDLQLVGPSVHVELGEGGVPTFLTRALGVSNARPASEAGEGSGDAAAAEISGTAEAQEGSAEEPAALPTTPTEEPAGLWADRTWWEKIPQRISASGLNVVVNSSNGVHGFALTDATLEYALRVFNFQMDLTVNGALASRGGAGQPIRVQAVWGWQDQNLQANIDVPELALDHLVGLLTQDPQPAVGGRLSFSTEFDEAASGPGLSWTGSVGFRDLLIQTSALQQPLLVDHLNYAWEASRTEDAPEALRFTQGTGSLNGQNFELKPSLFGFNYQRAKPFERIELEVEVPEQDAQELFLAIPPALRTSLDGAQFQGTWAWAIRFGFDITQDEDGWLRPAEIVEAESMELQDDTLHLVSLPESVDVRRLNSAFNFVFAGPENRFNRPLSAPAPRSGAGDPADAPEETAAPQEDDNAGNRWVRLQGMSYYLLAMQLYREDGRFFENRGINWFQLRKVVEEVFVERRLGRGASTISMQLIKNVFLSHERSLERKLTELFLTYWMTRLVPKERILEVYLNIIEWGPNVNGIAEASRYYFGKSPSELSFSEATWLAAITPAPARRASQRDMGSPPAWMMQQCHDLMRGLHERGFVTDAELQAGLNEEIRFVTHPMHSAAPLESDTVPSPVDPATGPPASATTEATGPDASALIPVAAVEEAPVESELLRLSPPERIEYLIRRSISLRP
jgi:hypothetical protein